MSGGIATPTQAVAAANSWSTYAHRFCLQAVSRMYQFGSPTQVSKVNPPINDITTAAQEWARCPAQYRHEGLAAILAAPVGALIVCGVGDGHIFIVVAPGRGRSTDYPSAGKMGTDSIQNILNHFSGNTPLGWISWINGNTIDGLGTAPTGPMQRVARLDVGVIRRRSEPNTTSTLLDPALQPGETGNFVGFVHGEHINQNGVDSDVWLKGISGNYFWLGGFIDRDLHNLPDLTVYPPASTTTRKVLSTATANARDAAVVAGTLKQSVPAGSPVDMAGYVHGESVSGNDVWFKTAVSGYFMWSGGFEGGANTAGLSDITTTPPPTTDPPATQLDTSYKTFTADSPLAKWVGSPNYGKRDPKLPKDHITLHWMAGTLAGTDQTFQSVSDTLTPDGHSLNVATTYGVGLTEIHQYVKENEYHHGDGNADSNASGISIEHEGGYTLADGSLKAVDDRTYELSIKLVADVAKRNGMGVLKLGVNVFPHNHYVQTTCPGTLDMQRIVDGANAINYPPATDPGDGGTTDPTGPTTPGTPTVDIKGILAVIGAVLAAIAALILGSK